MDLRSKWCFLLPRHISTSGSVSACTKDLKSTYSNYDLALGLSHTPVSGRWRRGWGFLLKKRGPAWSPYPAGKRSLEYMWKGQRIKGDPIQHSFPINIKLWLPSFPSHLRRVNKRWRSRYKICIIDLPMRAEKSPVGWSENVMGEDFFITKTIRKVGSTANFWVGYGDEYLELCS